MVVAVVNVYVKPRGAVVNNVIAPDDENMFSTL